MEGLIKRAARVLDDFRMDRDLTQNINLDLTKKQKHILICYLSYSHINKMYRKSAYHTNVLEMFQMIRVLISLNFCIDIVSFDAVDALNYVSEKQYDYIFGMGDTFRKAVYDHREAKSIIYMTENPYYVSKREEEKRIDYLYERKKIKIQMERTGKFYQEDDEKKADYIICMGETKYYSSQQKKVFRIYPTAIKNTAWENDSKKRKCTNFLVFGTGGFVHKGNDLLVEAFAKHPDWNLFLCGQDIKKEVKKLNYSLPCNVYDCGFLSVNSPEFIDLVSKCTYILLPSASEGMPTGILTGMQHGLIPVVMPGIGMDEFQDYCEYFEGYEISDIEKKIDALTKCDDRKEKSDVIYQFANETFCLSHFSMSFQKIMESIMVEDV